MAQAAIATKIRQTQASSFPSTIAGSASAADVQKLEYELAEALNDVAELKAANKQLAQKAVLADNRVSLASQNLSLAELESAEAQHEIRKLRGALVSAQRSIADLRTPTRVAKDVASLARTNEVLLKSKVVVHGMKHTLQSAADSLRQWQRTELASLEQLRQSIPVRLVSRSPMSFASPSPMSKTPGSPTAAGSDGYSDPDRTFTADDARLVPLMRSQAALKAEASAERAARARATQRISELEAELAASVGQGLLVETLEKLSESQRQHGEAVAAAQASRSALMAAEVQLWAAKSELAGLREEVRVMKAADQRERQQQQPMDADDGGIMSAIMAAERESSGVPPLPASVSGASSATATGAHASSTTGGRQQPPGGDVETALALARLRFDYESRLDEVRRDAAAAAAKVEADCDALQLRLEKANRDRIASGYSMREAVLAFEKERQALVAQIDWLRKQAAAASLVQQASGNALAVVHEEDDGDAEEEDSDGDDDGRRSNTNGSSSKPEVTVRPSLALGAASSGDEDETSHSGSASPPLQSPASALSSAAASAHAVDVTSAALAAASKAHAEQVSSLLAELSDARSHISQAARLAAELDEVKSAAADREVQWHKTAMDHALGWQRQLLDWQGKAREADRRASEAALAADASAREVDDIHAQLHRRNKDVAALKGRIVELQLAMEKAGREAAEANTSFEQQVETARDLAHAKDKVIEHLRTQLAPLQKRDFKESDLTAQVKECQAVIDALKDKLRESVAAQQAATAKLSTKDNDLVALAGQIPTHVSTVTRDLQAQAGRMRDEVDTAKAAAGKAAAEADSLRKQVAALESENGRLKRVGASLQRFADIALAINTPSLSPTKSPRRTSVPAAMITSDDVDTVAAGIDASMRRDTAYPAASRFIGSPIGTDGRDGDALASSPRLPLALASALKAARAAATALPGSRDTMGVTSRVDGEVDGSDVGGLHMSPRTRGRANTEDLTSRNSVGGRARSVGTLPPSTVKKRMAARVSRSALIKSGLIHPSMGLAASARHAEENGWGIDQLASGVPSLPEPLLRHDEIGHAHPSASSSSEVFLQSAPTPRIGNVPLHSLRSASPPPKPPASLYVPPHTSRQVHPRQAPAATPAHGSSGSAGAFGVAGGRPRSASAAPVSPSSSPFRSTVFSDRSKAAEAAAAKPKLAGTVRKPRRILAKWGLALYLLRGVQLDNDAAAKQHGFDVLRCHMMQKRVDDANAVLSHLRQTGVPPADVPGRVLALKAEVMQLQATVSDALRRLDLEVVDNGRLRAAVESTHASILDLQSKLQSEREALVTLREESRRLTNALGDTETERTALEEEVSGLRSVASRVPLLEAERSRAVSDLAALQSELDHVKHSQTQLSGERQLIFGISELLSPRGQAASVASEPTEGSAGDAVPAILRIPGASSVLPPDIALLREQAVAVAEELRAKAEAIKSLEGALSASNEALSTVQRQHEATAAELARLRAEHVVAMAGVRAGDQAHADLQAAAVELAAAKEAHDAAEAAAAQAKEQAAEAEGQVKQLQGEVDTLVARAAQLATAKASLEADLMRSQVALRQAELRATMDTRPPAASSMPYTPARAVASTPFAPLSSAVAVGPAASLSSSSFHSAINDVSSRMDEVSRTLLGSRAAGVPASLSIQQQPPATPVRSTPAHEVASTRDRLAAKLAASASSSSFAPANGPSRVAPPPPAAPAAASVRSRAGSTVGGDIDLAAMIATPQPKRLAPLPPP